MAERTGAVAELPRACSHPTSALPPPRLRPCLQVFKRLGLTLSRDQCNAVANADGGAIERTLKAVRAGMARFQEGAVARSGSGGSPSHAAASTSQPVSPAYAHGGYPAAGGAEAAADSIAALRIAADVPAKYAQQGMGGGAVGSAAASKAAAAAAAAAGYPTLDHAVAASLEAKECQLEELRETNEARVWMCRGGCLLQAGAPQQGLLAVVRLKSPRRTLSRSSLSADPRDEDLEAGAAGAPEGRQDPGAAGAAAGAGDAGRRHRRRGHRAVNGRTRCLKRRMLTLPRPAPCCDALQALTFTVCGAAGKKSA